MLGLDGFLYRDQQGSNQLIQLNILVIYGLVSILAY
jgi:hypothetical protein